MRAGPWTRPPSAMTGAPTILLLVAAVLARNAGAQDWVRQSRASIQTGNYLEAARICERGMLAEPDSEELETAYLSLPAEILAARWAERYERAQRTTDARELIALGRELSDFDPHRKTDGPKLALELLARAVRMAPDNPSAYFEYGRALRTNGSPEEMFAAWDHALALHPDDALTVRIYTWIGKQRSVLAQPEPAAQAFRAAHEINRKPALRQPRWAWEYFSFLQAQSQEPEARKLLAEILAWSPGFAPAMLERARLSIGRQAWEEGIRDAEFALRHAGGNAELERGAHSLLARAYHVLNQEPQARRHEAWIEEHPR
jgi:tetratricopeptide (TPR) repeat protein